MLTDLGHCQRLGSPEAVFGEFEGFVEVFRPLDGVFLGPVSDCLVERFQDLGLILAVLMNL